MLQAQVSDAKYMGECRLKNQVYTVTWTVFPKTDLSIYLPVGLASTLYSISYPIFLLLAYPLGSSPDLLSLFSISTCVLNLATDWVSKNILNKR